MHDQAHGATLAMPLPDIRRINGQIGSKGRLGSSAGALGDDPGGVRVRLGRFGQVGQAAAEAGPSAQPVIIRYRDDAKESDVKNRIERRRGRVVAEHRLIPAMTAIVSAADIADLANDPDVLSVSADADVTASAGNKHKSSANSTTSYSSADYNTVSTLKQALGLQDWFTGSNMTVAVIDSGIQNSNDFTGRLVGMYDFTPGGTAHR